jgi:putative endonuclease
MKREYHFYVYIMASKSRVIYTGMTNNIENRVWQHKNDLIEGFTKKYKCHRLVHRESFDDVRNAINREKEIKAWRREKKIALIDAKNPFWNDLAEEWFIHHRYEPPEQIDGVKESRSLATLRDDTLT